LTQAREITVAELARRVEGVVEGDGSARVRLVETLEQADEHALAWLGDAKLLPQLASTRAAAVLVPRDYPVPVGKTVIRVDDPDLAMCRAQALLAPSPPGVPVGVHATAVVADDARVAGAAIGANVFVGPGAEVGAGTQLHPGVYVGAEAKIGRDCVLWPNVVVRERVSIGERVTIHANATIGADGFGYLQRGGRHIKIPQVGRVVIEDDVEIGANTTIDRARSGVTRIRRGAKIDNLVQIGHNCEIGEDCIIVAQCGISGSTTLGRGVMLAGQVGLIDHLKIGDAVQVAAKSGVARDIPDGAVFRGIPARENQLYVRQEAAVRRLPELIRQVRELRKRVEQLESSADHRARS